MIAAIGILACLVYLAAGRHDIGTSAFDVAFSPAMPAHTQLAISSRDVPGDSRFSLTSAIARASIAVARGRRTALRDLAAVSSAAVIVLFGVWLRAIGVPLFAVALAMLAMMTGQTFWWRGIVWSRDVLTPSIGQTVSLTAEFTRLGLCLAAIGAVVLLVDTTRRIPTLAIMIVAVAAYLTGIADLPLVICGWAAVAIAFAWLLRVLPERSGPAIVTLAAIVLIASPALARMRLSALGRDLDSTLAARSAYDLRKADLPENAVLIAESRRADAFARLSGIPIIPQSAEDIEAAQRDGRALVAFPGAQRHLATTGWLFERAYAGNIPVAIVAGRTACIDLVRGEWRDVSLLTAAGSFILHGPAYGSAPGGAVFKLTSARKTAVSAIEPRSTPFEVTDAGDSTTIRIPRSGREDAVTVTLDAAPVTAAATADEGNPVKVCAGVMRMPLLLDRRANASAQIHMNEPAPFVSGWYPIEADPDYFRWTAPPESIIRIAMTPPGPVRITITATPAARAAQSPTIGLSVNSCRLERHKMQQGLGDYEWVAGAECWQPGMNLVRIGVEPLISPASLGATHDTRLLGARIGAIRLARVQNAK